ncbi:MAG: hypothetical protein KA978_06145 [Deltaproteobacteria bacterium]|jgi:hypothetical protein|nr:hypothetical protein [Deltaproteobacteria bacterium]MBP6830344.1 hypothetical protein [Deltaproteobacteria bacterium]
MEPGLPKFSRTRFLLVSQDVLAKNSEVKLAVGRHAPPQRSWAISCWCHGERAEADRAVRRGQVFVAPFGCGQQARRLILKVRA